LVGNLKERDRWKELGVDGRIIFKLICKMRDGDMDWIDLAQECGNEPSGSIKYWKFLG
jgi:hypothetical protein